MANGHLLLIWSLCLFTSCFSEYHCPRGAKIDRDGLCCYWMPTFTSTWLAARSICQRENEGDVAMVDSVTVQTLIQNLFQMEAHVRVWLRNGTPPSLGNGTMKPCTSMALATGQWMNENCDNGNFMICQKTISVPFPSLESYVTGVPLMSAMYPVAKNQLLPSSPDPGQQRVEIMLFPGLWFSHEGRVISLDLVAQPSDQVTYAKVQILRPYCSLTHHLVPPGCSSLLNAFSCCSLMPLCNTTGACASGQYWCHLLEICLPVTSPCSPYDSSDKGRVFTLPPRYPATSPNFHLIADMALKLEPSADPKHISVTTRDKEITVYPDDILAVQHTRRAGEFLHCVAGTSSAWRQSYLSLYGPEWGGWLEGVLSAQSGQGQWIDGVVCDIRVIYEDTMSYYGFTTIPTTTQTNGSIKASLVKGLQLLYPKLDKHNQVHIAVNAPTLILIKITSGENATSFWSSPVNKNKVSFHSSCPAEMLQNEEGCVRSPDTWFSHVYMMLSGEGEHLLNITALNSLNFQTLSVRVVGHFPVTGLSIQPQGLSRVLVGVPQLFTASVVTGSPVSYTWVIDDMTSFPHVGESYSVVFQKPAEYKLKVTGRNGVSSQLIEVKITADLMTPLADLAVISTPGAIAVHTSFVYTMRVKADISIGVTISWDFGDNTSSVSHAVSAASQMKDSHLYQPVKHVYLQDSTHHTYSFQGEYTLKIKAYNKYDHIESSVLVKVRAPLSRLLVTSSPTVGQLNRTITFDVTILPSSYAMLCSWRFGDDSREMKENNTKVSHIFNRPGNYNVTTCANNTVSVLCNYTAVEIVEPVSRLWLNYTSFIEVNSIFEIVGKVSSGTHLKWTFEFGDGSVFEDHSESSASHIYKSPGKYMVHVTAYNSVSKEQQSVHVEVYTLLISNILPSGCIESETEIEFEVLVKGHVPILTFYWDFGDGTPTFVVKGTATVTHTFLTTGTYTVGVNARSLLGSAYCQTTICVEAIITDVELQSTTSAVAVSEKICFDVSVNPKAGDYMFWWNSNISSDALVLGLSHHCFVFTADGSYDISVLVGNKVSNKTAKMTIFVQRIISDLSIKYEGNLVALIVNQFYYFWAEFSGSIDHFQWDFGDGSSKMEGQNQSHIFPLPGRYRVTLIASNAISSESVFVDVEVQAPLTCLTVNTSRPFAEAGTHILIKAQADIMENVKFYWTVNTLSFPTLGTSEFFYVFPKAGVFEVKVTAQNDVSHLETKIDIQVIERIHEVQILCQGLQSAKYFLTNQSVVLTASILHGSNLTYEWQTHDSGIYKTVSNSEQFELFAYNPGDIKVKLVVSNVIGSVDSELSLRAVELVSGVSISSPLNVLTKEKPVMFTVSVESGTDLQYSWFFNSEDHPVLSDVPFILHAFNVIGVIKLRVSVSNVFGSVDATKLLKIQEIISEVDIMINGQSKPFFVRSHSLLFLQGFAKTVNVQHWKWTLTFDNNTVITLADNCTVSYSVDVGDHQISLNASNDISWQIVSYNVRVQDSIQELWLGVSNNVVCENDPITFTPSVSRGSEITFTLEFMNEGSYVDFQQNFTTSSLTVGNHLVRVRAKNNVSEQTATVTVQVVENIKDLHVIGCCPAVLQASKRITFQVVENSASQVNYHWTFLLNGVDSSQEIGQNVHFTPITNGSLSVTLKADNGFCSKSLSLTATVQSHVREVKLLSSHYVAFIDYPIYFTAITDGGSDLKFIWDFGEPNGVTLVTKYNTQDHKYNVTGRYVVHLTVLNNISRVSSQIAIEVQKLECTQPQVYLVEKQSPIVKSRSSLFEARVDLKGCSTRKASYLWEIFKDCSATDKITVNGAVDVTTPLLFLPKHTLKVGNYCLTFTIRFLGTPLNHNKTINITVVHSKLAPLIKGGSHRIWSSQNDLILDATESYDPDSEDEDEGIQFYWDNSIENTTISPSVFATFHQLNPRNRSIIILPRSTLFPGAVYHFILTLYKDGRQPVSASQSVMVYETDVLPVAVKCVSCYSQLSSHVSYSQNVVLAGYCSSCKDKAQYTWTAENQRGEAQLLNKITTSTGKHSTDLVIRPGVLIEGHKYTFTLNVSEPSSGLWGSASITLVPNHPPYGGTCTLSPDDSLHFLETLVSYNCSGWMDDDGESAQLIFSLQVAQCEDFGPLCPLLTLYRGTQSMFGSLVPMGSTTTTENTSSIHVLVRVEDNMGASVIPVRKNLTMLLSDSHTIEWLRNRSLSEFKALLQQGNPQDIIQYSVAMTSRLNQLKTVNAQELEDKIQMRGNVTRALASLPVSSIQDAAQIISALAQSTAIPSEVRCKSCHAKVLKVTEKMIKVIRKQSGQRDVDPTDTGRNILSVLSSTLTADHSYTDNSGLKQSHTETATSVLSQILELMRSLMMSQIRGEEALSLVVPKISLVGVRGDPTKDLLCADPLGGCQFYIPSALSSQLKEENQEVLQVLLEMTADENPFVTSGELPVSTLLAAMEFATPQGQPIPIANLTPDTAIQFTLQKKRGKVEDERLIGKKFILFNKGSVNFTIKAMETDPKAGLYVTFNFSFIPGTEKSASGQVWISISDRSHHPSQHVYSEAFPVSLSSETSKLEYTIYLTPLLNGSAKDLFVNLTSSIDTDVHVSALVFSSLCRFFNVDEKRWSSEGLRPMSNTSPYAARCLTQHLTMFGATLFVHPDALVLLPPSMEPVRNVVVGLVCGVLLLIHLLIGLIAHKLDHLESQRLCDVPLCGQKGCYQYRILVKTGWKRGSGTTAHVGISLYGLNKTGSRHLQREGAFQRNSLDDFQIETDANLGEIWKIRIWHDNTGLDPSWYLQHVIVWDIQTENMFFFLVDDWLSVENERNSGRLEKVVLASCPQELLQFRRVLQAQLMFGLREHHLWISLWERPSHSSFSRAQRVTCCCLLLHLYLAAGTVWYGAVGRKGSSGPMSTKMVMNAETILVGMTMAALMFPLQIVLRLLFQKTKSKVTLESLPPSPVSHTVEMDVFLNGPNLSCSSFLSLPTGPDSSLYDGPSPFTNSLLSKNLDSEFWKDSDPSNNRLEPWASFDSIFGLSVLPCATHLLKRKKALLKLHLSTPTSAHDTLEPTKSPDEDLTSLSADEDPTLSSELPASDSGHFTPNESTLSEEQDSLCSDWSDLTLDTPTYETDSQKSCSMLSVLSEASTFLPSLPPDSISTASNTRIGVVRGVPAASLPSWILRIVHLLVAGLLGTCLTLVGLYGSRFTSSVVLMWLVSALSAFLTSSVLLEPFAICIQALYVAAVMRPVDPEVEERLAQEIEVRRTEEHLGDKVHPPSGYSLLQAKEEARKLRKLRALMRKCLVYMLFLLVVLMVNYQENVQENSSRQLHSAIKHTLMSTSPEHPALNALSGWMNAEQWIDKKLISHLYKNPSLSLIGLPRLQKVYSHNFCSQNIRDLFQSGGHPLMLASHFSSHANPGHQRSSEASENTPALLTRSSKDVSCLVNQREEVFLGNSSESARRILSGLQTSNWMTTGTQTALIEFTQYHKETSILAPVSVLLEQKQTGRISTFISIQPFHISQFSGSDLHITLTVVLLLFGLCFLSSEIWTLMMKPHHYMRQTCCWFQPLLALLTLATAVLRLYFLSVTQSSLSKHRSHPDSFTDFHSAASLARTSSQLSAVLLTLLVLKMVGVLRFVRRWLVLGRIIRQSCSQICTIVLLLLLLLLLFSHTGMMLFSSSVEGFRTLGQASHSLLCLLKGNNGLHRLCEHHPVLGPLYCLCAVGIAFWVLGRLCAAVLIQTYRMIQADINRPPLEPQDYEMVQFLIKRLKLWMGLSKTKEFRHRVKFEGMVPPPSRSSQDSQASNLSMMPSPVVFRQASPASVASDFTFNSDSLDFNHYVDRLLPVVDNLLACFDRVNQVTEEVYHFELQLEEVQKKNSQTKHLQHKTTKGRVPTPKLPQLTRDQSTSSSSSFQGISKAFSQCRGTFSESSLLGPSFRFGKRIVSALNGRKNSANSGNGGVPRRRAWNSMTCHSADTTQRLPGSHGVSMLPVRPHSEEGDREGVRHGVPVKRQAWLNE